MWAYNCGVTRRGVTPPWQDKSAPARVWGFRSSPARKPERWFRSGLSGPVVSRCAYALPLPRCDERGVHELSCPQVAKKFLSRFRVHGCAPSLCPDITSSVPVSAMPHPAGVLRNWSAGYYRLDNAKEKVVPRRRTLLTWMWLLCSSMIFCAMASPSPAPVRRGLIRSER